MALSTFLNGRPYTTLRGAAMLALSDTGYIVTGTVTSDSGGGGTTVWTAGTAAIPCRVDALGGSESLMAGRISDASTHMIAIPAGASLDVRNRFAITGRGTFEITAVSERTAELFRQVEAAQI